MKFKKTISGLCVGLVLIFSFPKPVKAEFPIEVFLQILGVIAATATVWIAMESATLAERHSTTESLLKHLELEKNAEFPINGKCVSPDIKNGTVKKAWLVSTDDKKISDIIVKAELCKAGGQSKNGKYVIGAFISEYHAKNFAKIVKYRTENGVNVYVSEKAIEY
ncbi:hypothetical protein [Nodularia chucula]|uniref:hypothetical protein n=1 Tax=Nodularia chucula TaxID=3093667 RepID=UPI0039C61BFC